MTTKKHMTMREYMQQHKGEACIELDFGTGHLMLMGVSERYDDELFFYVSEEGKVEGPCYFDLAKKRADYVVSFPLHDGCILETRIPENRGE